MTTQELVERLRNVSEWNQIIERHRRVTDDPRISYVLKVGTRVHEDEDVIAKLAASLSRALEDAASVSDAAASRLSEMDAEIKRLREALQRIGACHYEFVEGVAVGEGPPVFSAEMMARIARAALEHDKGEPKP